MGVDHENKVTAVRYSATYYDSPSSARERYGSSYLSLSYKPENELVLEWDDVGKEFTER